MAIRGLATAGGRPSVAAARDGPDMMTRPTRFPRSLGLLAAVLLGVLPETVPAQTPAQAPAPAPVQAPAPAAAQAPPAASERIEQLPPVVVIDSTPVPGLGIPVEKYPGNVQSVPPGDIDNRNRLDVSDTLLRGIGSVSINANQGNPWQSDLTYRGFLASPLAGSPIGLSMYLDGMRFNDGFGETINWDLIPQSAIAGIDVIPGSNPIFGLNTLGGALAVHTKRGFDHPGVKLEASGGSFGRWAVERRVGRLSRPVRLVPHLQRAERGRLARALAERPPPGLRQGRLPHGAHGRGGELRLRRQHAHRQRRWRRRASWRGTGTPCTRSRTRRRT